jgi:sterol desaturase/sphingolipid hydroxylase (fatty acid hydroxylase superfamily)
MEAKYIAAAIPLFFLLIGLELLLARRVYSFPDAINNLACGVGQQVIGVLHHSVPVLLYGAIYERLRLFTVPAGSATGWIGALFGVDLCYYAFHRAAHRVNFLWAGHAAHHQSEEYNFSVALRQSWFVQFVGFAFYLPLALIGFPPVMYFSMVTVMTLYQFWIHTRLIGRLGPLEWVLNTPSHHRVHHGIDPEYLDRNYGGILIVWDRLFGTFRREAQEPVYGTVTPLSSWNPLWANIEVWKRIGRIARDARRRGDKLTVWFRPPEWRPGGALPIPTVSRASQRKYATASSRRVDAWVAANFALVLFGLTVLLLHQKRLAPSAVWALALWILWSLSSMPGLFERRPWAVPMEVARMTVLACGLGWALA